MTREYHIEILKQYKEKPTLINEISSVEEAVWLDEALDAAIKALEEPCEDVISRADAILQIQRHGVGCFDPDEFSPEICERFVIDLISKLPSYRLEYESKEPCEDAISRQSAIDGLNSINGTSELDKAFEVIENLPPVNPQPKTEVLDKIRAEIQEYADKRKNSLFGDGLRQALEIIDKYKAESEK